MSPKHWLPALASFVAMGVGVCAGIFLGLLSTPTAVRAETFTFNRVSVISWRGGGDNVPASVTTNGWAAPMFYGTPAEGAYPSPPEGKFPTGDWAPGDTVQRSLVVKNVDPDYVMRIEAMQVTLTGEPGLAPFFRLTVTGPANQLLYTGKLSDFSAGSLPFRQPVLLKRGDERSLTFTVSLDRATDQRYEGKTVKADFVIVARSYTLPMTIDIHPSSWPNPINPGARGNIPVAINGSASMDVRQLDWTTARFGPNVIPPLRKDAFSDWNKDGYIDMILHFDNPSSGITCGMATATLTIYDFDGNMYEGFDYVVTPPCR